MEIRPRNHQQLQPSNGLVVIDPLLCTKNLTSIEPDKTLSNERSVCETVAEVTENVTVSQRDSSDLKTNNNSNINCIDHSLSNGDINSSSTEKLLPAENGEIRNGHHVTGNDNENETVVMNGETIEYSTTSSSQPVMVENDNSHLDNKDTTPLLENGSCDDSIDEEIAGNNIFLKLVNDEAEVLTKEREYFLGLINEATAVSEEGRN